VLLLIKLKNFRKPKRKSEGDEERFSIGKKFVIGVRICVSAALSATGMLFAAKALMLYDNLAVLAMLPVSGCFGMRSAVWLTRTDLDVRLR
jgi:hypothetical protein